MSGFYIVWSPDGPTPPQKVHDCHAKACHAAWTLARDHPGREFFIMGRKGRPAMVAPEGAAEAEQAA